MLFRSRNDNAALFRNPITILNATTGGSEQPKIKKDDDWDDWDEDDEEEEEEW